TEGIANFLNSLSGAKAVLVLKVFADGKIKGSLRSTMPGVDVSKLATALGGGGHKKAAGFTIPGRLKRRGSRWQLV
ncbi:MAG: DHHA1 domain-containing protein, partial [bacterium]|nr:DHHA1 domain-containing protein [bacterium]